MCGISLLLARGLVSRGLAVAEWIARALNRAATSLRYNMANARYLEPEVYSRQERL